MSEAIERGGCWMFKCGQHDQHTGMVSVGVTLSSAEEAFAVLPKDMQLLSLIRAEQLGGI